MSKATHFLSEHSFYTDNGEVEVVDIVDCITALSIKELETLQHFNKLFDGEDPKSYIEIRIKSLEKQLKNIL